MTTVALLYPEIKRLPIFFVKKPFEEHEEMEIDESMITHHDFQDIIIESLR